MFTQCSGYGVSDLISFDKTVKLGSVCSWIPLDCPGYVSPCISLWHSHSPVQDEALDSETVEWMDEMTAGKRERVTKSSLVAIIASI